MRMGGVCHVCASGLWQSVEGEGRDRHLVGLPPNQLALAKAVLTACADEKPVVVVLINVSRCSPIAGCIQQRWLCFAACASSCDDQFFFGK